MTIVIVNSLIVIQRRSRGLESTLSYVIANMSKVEPGVPPVDNVKLVVLVGGRLSSPNGLTEDDGTILPQYLVKFISPSISPRYGNLFRIVTKIKTRRVMTPNTELQKPMGTKYTLPFFQEYRPR